MLTKQDFRQIKQIVRDEVVSESKNTNRSIRAEVKLARIEIQNDLNDLLDRIKDLEK